MILRRSEFCHLVTLDETRILAIHAITQFRAVVTPEVARLIAYFDTPLDLDRALPRLIETFGHDADSLREAVIELRELDILSEESADDERRAISRELANAHGRDPAAQLDRYRRANMEGSHPYWAVEAPRTIMPTHGTRRRIDVLLFGDCDIQIETDFLRQEALSRGIDLHVAATFAADIALAGERHHDIVIIGALQARHAIVVGDKEHHNGDPAAVYVSAMRAMLEQLRALTNSPILLNGLPEPTLQPLGMADRGGHSHRNRFRRTNLALEELVEDFADVTFVDVAAVLAEAGSGRLLDDGLVSFTHFGSLGWMLQRPDSELAAVHGQFPDMQPLADIVGGDPYRQEGILARAHMDAISVVLALDRKKCVIVDLDGVLWPGVLAETGSPFAWSPEVSSPNSYIGLYFGIHEALLALRRRGILLACVSKNDEATVRRLWHYPPEYPQHRLISPASFVTRRINWDDKADNISSIAHELGFARDACVFIDDTERERERVRQSLPEITVLGDNLFALRRILLTDPRLQTPLLTRESANRTELVKSQLDRDRLRTTASTADAFIASLEVESIVEQLHTTSDPTILHRVRELFDRTTQFNATGRRFSLEELRQVISSASGRVFTLRMRDRLAEHGLVGAAVVKKGEILNLAMSCRVIGLGGERALLTNIIDERNRETIGTIVQTDRNTPVRHLYRDHGFTDRGDGRWTLQAR